LFDSQFPVEWSMDKEDAGGKGEAQEADVDNNCLV